MKFETILLHSLFAASLLICVGVLGAMLTTQSPARNVAADHTPAAVPAAVLASAAG